jgi:uncharacterized cupin superfamily protein
VLIVEEQERRLGKWDFVHCPPNTPHVIVGAGTGRCAVLMVGARNAGEDITYSVSRAAARFGASVDQETGSPDEAYAAWLPMEPRRYPWPPRTA